MTYLKNIMFNFLQILGKFFRLIMIAAISLATGCSSNRLQFKNSDVKQHDICWQKINQFNALQDVLNGALDRQIYQYQEVVEEMLVNREAMVSLITGIDQTKPIPSAVLDVLNLRMQIALGIVDRLVSVIDSNQCWQEADINRMQKLGLLPLDPVVQLKGSMLALSALLMLYDSYQAVVVVINEDGRIRRFLNQSDIGYGIQEDQLSAITDDFLSISNLSNIENQIASYQQRKAAIQLGIVSDDNSTYLDTLIHSTRSYDILRKASVDDKISRRFGKHTNSISDSLNALNRSAVNGISELFGNAVGARLKKERERCIRTKRLKTLSLVSYRPVIFYWKKPPLD